jgi:hypothetical protein
MRLFECVTSCIELHRTHRGIRWHELDDQFVVFGNAQLEMSGNGMGHGKDLGGARG